MPDAPLPDLDGPRLPPVGSGRPDRLVVLLHGVGANGQDLIGLAPFFQDAAARALFVAPDAPFPFDMAPFGCQWFSIAGDEPGRGLDLEARLPGVRTAAPILDRYLDALLDETGLDESHTVLAGFSQGCMMALHVGLRRERTLAGILGYSGALVAPRLLADEIRSRPRVMLVHGDADEVVPIDFLGQAVEGLKAADVTVAAHPRPGLGHGIDEEGVALGIGFLSRVLG